MPENTIVFLIEKIEIGVRAQNLFRDVERPHKTCPKSQTPAAYPKVVIAAAPLLADAFTDHHTDLNHALKETLCGQRLAMTRQHRRFRITFESAQQMPDSVWRKKHVVLSQNKHVGSADIEHLLDPRALSAALLTENNLHAQGSESILDFLLKRIAINTDDQTKRFNTR